MVAVSRSLNIESGLGVETWFCLCNVSMVRLYFVFFEYCGVSVHDESPSSEIEVHQLFVSVMIRRVQAAAECIWDSACVNSFDLFVNTGFVATSGLRPQGKICYVDRHIIWSSMLYSVLLGFYSSRLVWVWCQSGLVMSFVVLD